MAIDKNLNNYYYSNYPNFKAGQKNAPAIISKPIEHIENVTNNIVDKFVKDSGDEEKKKSNKKAITVGSTVLVLGGLVAILNPKTSTKMMNKLKVAAQKAGNKAKTDKTWKGNLYRGAEKGIDKTIQFLQFTNNINTMKDESFQWLCRTKKEFSGIKNDTLRSFMQKSDSIFRKVMDKPHQAITKGFDKISKQTVKGKLKSAQSKMDNLEQLFMQYKDKLSPSEKTQFENILKEIAENRKYFSEEQLVKRLENQEQLMSNLEKDTLAKINPYVKGLFKKEGWKDNLKNNMYFWAESIMMPERNKLEQQGLEQLVKLIGDGKGQKGKYQELLELLSKHLSQEEKALLEDSLGKTAKKLRRANKSECVEYFDKKRDLMLGSAPTDVLTAVAGIGLSGIAIGTAEDKQERISRAVTVAFPAIAGLGASLAMTAMLFSGIQGMIYGSLASIGLSKIGSFTDKHFISKAPKTQKQEVQIA